MNCFCPLALIILLGFPAPEPSWGADQPKYQLVATPPSLAPGETAKFQLQGSPPVADFNLAADPDAGLTCDNAKKTCTAKDAPGKGLAITGEVTVTATFNTNQSAKATVTLTGQFDAAKRGPWEARAIIGYHQAGGASADFSQNVAVDIFVVRPLSRHSEVWKARWNSWGNVRIASAPRQINTPFVSLLQGLLVGGDNSPLKTNANEMALSAEFQSGIELNLTPKWNGKVLGLIGFFGATGAFEPPDKSIRIYKVPSRQSPQYNLFEQQFPSAVNSTYVGFVTPDRDRFYRQWGFGFRYAKFNPQAYYESPQTFSFTLGRDEAITSGVFQSAVARFDAFYPLPVGQSDGRFKFLYLFATSTLRLSRSANRVPLVLEGAPSTVKGSEDSVAIVSTGTNRDTYRIGIGVDLVNLMRSFFKP